MKPFSKLSSAASTAHALILSAIELPDALRELLELAREHTSTRAEVDFWLAARNRWMDWACHVEGGQRTPGTDDGWDGDSEMMARIAEALRENSELRADISAVKMEHSELERRLSETEDAMQLTDSEWLRASESRDELSTQIIEARSQLRALSSWLGFGLGDENESLPSLVQRVKEGVENHFGVMGRMRDQAWNERDELKSELSLVSFIAGEAWSWAKERITQLQIDNDSLGGALSMEHDIAVEMTKERDEFRDRIVEQSRLLEANEARLEALESQLWRSRDRVDALSRERDTAIDGLESVTIERDELLAKLKRFEAAEEWHDVINGIGELPPDGKDVLWQVHTWVDKYYVSVPGSKTYRWRFISSEDVPRC